MLARRGPGDVDHLTELEASLDDRVSELVGEVNDAGYSTAEALEALLRVTLNQACISSTESGERDDGRWTPNIPSAGLHAAARSPQTPTAKRS